MVGRKTQSLAFARFERQHGLATGAEKAFALHCICPAIHHGRETLPDQVCHLRRAVCRHDPGISRHTRVRRRNRFAVTQVVVRVDVVQKQDAGFGKVIGGLHHRVPHVTRRHGLVNPQAIRTLEGTLRNQGGTGPGLMHQLPRLVVVQRLHESV